MKKLNLGLVVVMLSIAQVDASHHTFLDSVKLKTMQALSFAKTKTAYALSCIRESNAMKIQKAIEAKEVMLEICASLQLDVDGENVLLQNIRALGFDKQNAVSALTTIQKYCASMQAIVSRYNAPLAPWNRSTAMMTAVYEVLPCLQKSKIYVQYFESHKDCLKGWELVRRYERADIVDVTDANAALSTISVWYKNNDAYNLVKSVDLLNNDIVYIKSCLMNNSYRQAYPELYEQLYAFLPSLEFVVHHVLLSNEYKAQWFYKTNKPSLPAKQSQFLKQNQKVLESAKEIATEPAMEYVGNQEDASINHEQIIARTDQFGNNPY